MGADDAYLLRSQLWTADGRTLLRSRPTPPLSASGAYGRVATAVPRPAAAAEARRDLPVVQSEADVMDAIAGADVVVLCGATGSGKTSQLPQMLWEAGYGAAPIRAPRDVSAANQGGGPGPDAAAPPPPPVWLGIPGMIGVTQPRRVAATAMARRVAAEMGVPCGPGGKSGATPNVGYQVRYDASHVDPRTRIKFMTDGILLRELQVRGGRVHCRIRIVFGQWIDSLAAAGSGASVEVSSQLALATTPHVKALVVPYPMHLSTVETRRTAPGAAISGRG